MFLFLRNKHMHFLSHLHHFATWLAWLTVHSYIAMGDQWIAREQLIKRVCEGSARFKVLNMHWSACPRAISSKCAAENSLLRFPIHLLKNVAKNQVVGVKWVNQSFKANAEKQVCAERDILSMPGPLESDNQFNSKELLERTICEVISVWWYS